MLIQRIFRYFNLKTRNMDYVANYSFTSSEGKYYRKGDEISESEYKRIARMDRAMFSQKKRRVENNPSSSSSDYTPSFSIDDSPSPSHSSPSWDFGGGSGGGAGSSSDYSSYDSSSDSSSDCGGSDGGGCDGGGGGGGD